MKRLAIAFFLAFAALASAGGAWQTYKPSDGSFSVSFPEKPLTKKAVQTYKGVQVPMEMAASGVGTRAFITVRMDFSALGNIKGRENDLLNFGAAGLSKQKGYNIVSQDSFQLKGHQGRHIVLRKGSMEQQIYVVLKGAQAIMVIVGAEHGKSDDQLSRKFIASFKLS